MTDDTTCPGPVQDPAVRAKVAALHAKGMGRNAIAAELGLENSTVTRIAKALGLDFSRAQTAVAVQARSIDLAAGRQRLAEKILERGEKMLDELTGPYLVYSFGGKNNTYAEHTLDRAPVEVQRTAVATAGTAFDRVTKFLKTVWSVEDGERPLRLAEAVDLDRYWAAVHELQNATTTYLRARAAGGCDRKRVA